MPDIMIMMTNIRGVYVDYMVTWYQLTSFLKNYIITINSRRQILEHFYMQFGLKTICVIYIYFIAMT
jgi:hypothetical protein